MKISLTEAYDILEIEPDEEGGLVDEILLKKAFHRKSLACHPDKRPPEEKEQATKEFQRINAAYQSACAGQGHSDDEDAYADGPDINDIFNFFANFHAEYARGGGARGGRSGGGPGMAFSFGPGGGVYVHFGGPSGGGYGGRQRGGRHSNQNYYYSDSEDYYSSDEDDGFVRKAAYRERRGPSHKDYREREERREQDAEMQAKHEREVQARAEAARVEAQQKSLQAKWMVRMGRPVKTAWGEESITINVDRTGKRAADTMGGSSGAPLGQQYLFWELQYRMVPHQFGAAGPRPQPGGGGPCAWQSQEVAHAVLEVTVSRLQPGTKYAFRARPCKRLGFDDMVLSVGRASPGGKVWVGDWSVEAEYATKGEAPASARVAPPPASVAAAGGKKAARKAREVQQQKQQQAQQAQRASAEVEAERTEAEMAAEMERLKAKEAKEAAIRAALDAAAADYAAEVAKAAAGAAEQQATAAAAAAPAGKAKKSRKKAGKRPEEEAPPPFVPETAPASQQAAQPAMLPPSRRHEFAYQPGMGSQSDVQRRAASMGMTVQQYLAIKEEEALEEAIRRSLAVEAPPVWQEPPPQADSALHFPSMFPAAAGDGGSGSGSGAAGNGTSSVDGFHSGSSGAEGSGEGFVGVSIVNNSSHSQGRPAGQASSSFSPPLLSFPPPPQFQGGQANGGGNHHHALFPPPAPPAPTPQAPQLSNAAVADMLPWLFPQPSA